MDILNFIKKLYKNNSLKKINKKATNLIIFKNSTTKHSMNSSCTLKFSTETENRRKEIEAKLKTIIKKYMDNPEKLINFIRLENGNVYKLKNAEKILFYIDEKEGFITPLKGFKALYLNLITGLICEKKIKLSFKTKPMFVFSYDNSEIYIIVRALHKYYGFKNNLPGFDYKSQEIFKKLYNNDKNRSLFLKRCTINEMYACKDAMSRDLESINFTILLSEEYSKAKKTLKKLKENNSASI